MQVAPSKFFICGRNAVANVRDSGITGTEPAEEALPLRHLKTADRDFVWQSANANEQDVVVSFESTLSPRANFVFLHRHNLETAGYWRTQLMSDYSGGAGSPTPLLHDGGFDKAIDFLTLGQLDFGGQALGGGSYSGFMGQRASVQWFMHNSDLVNSVRMTLRDTGNSAGCVRAAMLYIGEGIELENGALKIEMGWREDTEHKRTDGGSLLSDGALTWREMEVETMLAEEERAYMMDTWRYAGMRKDIFVSAYPGVGGEKERDYMMVCRFKDMPRVSATPDDQAAGLYRARFTLVEV